MSGARSGGWFVFVGLAAAACIALTLWPASRAPSREAVAASAAAAIDSVAPVPRNRVKTTDGEIAIGNLDARIAGFEAHAKRFANDGRGRAALSELYAVRGQYRARIADYERAEAAAEDAIVADPKEPSGYLARAAARAGLHRFSEAEADLDEAERQHRVAPAATRPQRAAILQGRGDLDGALALRQAESKAHPSITSLGAEAALLGELGRAEEASRLFHEAIEKYNDVSPLPVAWISFSEGVLWEKLGKKGRARAFFEDAHARLPAYAHAASHLAPLLPAAEGARILGPYVTTSDDPEIEGVYAERLQASGDKAGADKARAHARARYEELLISHPAAFAEHAGWFWLDEPDGAPRALALAKQNLEVRKTESGYRLGLLAAIAAKQPDDACTFARGALAMPHLSEMVRGIATDACKR